MIKLKNILKEDAEDYITAQDVLQNTPRDIKWDGEWHDRENALGWYGPEPYEIYATPSHNVAPPHIVQFELNNYDTGEDILVKRLNLKKYKGDKQSQLNAYFNMLKTIIKKVK